MNSLRGEGREGSHKNEISSLKAGLFPKHHTVKMPGEMLIELISSGSQFLVIGDVDTVIENGILKALLLRFERQFNLPIPKNCTHAVKRQGKVSG